ncbi:hypothetical protein [Geomesophilobacter sediminis]|uniref:Uncharacterized protein n=1 Tax=Geomesophilobacter sediminis TaxID=2798584 RepID=A0A8J7M1S8_9BACT|nr:hypothetical protein [Geomesophilobacter sediminis]MBJ6726928.1 hypothetical protein [Geomesophilobacter sediminis]
MYCILLMRLNKCRALLLLPFLVLQILVGVSGNHQHVANSYYDRHDPRHSFTTVNLARIKKAQTAHQAAQEVSPLIALATVLVRPHSASQPLRPILPSTPSMPSPQYLDDHPDRAPPA